jgi:hypothetical protein
VALVRAFFDQGKLVAAICHAPVLLVEAGVTAGRTLTSWPSIRTDLLNAGARWIDRELVEDGNLVTSRKPADLPAFCEAILRRLAGRPAEQREAASRDAGAPVRATPAGRGAAGAGARGSPTEEVTMGSPPVKAFGQGDAALAAWAEAVYRP